MHISINTKLPNKNSFFNNFTTNVFLFIAVIYLILVTTLVMYILIKHMKLKTQVISLALQQIKEVGAVTRQEIILLNIECVPVKYSGNHFDAKFISFKPNGFCHSMHMKTKIV